MARPKSEFLKAWGKMYEIIKALVDEILSLGGNDDCLQLILTDKKVRRSIAEILVNAGKTDERFFKFIGTVTIPATTEKFVVRDRFKADTSGEAQMNISFLGGDFKVWFLKKTEELIGATELHIHQLLQPSVDSFIIAELGGEDKVETTFAELYTLMEK